MHKAAGATAINQFPIFLFGSNGISCAPTQNFVDQFAVVTGSGGTLTSVDFDWDNFVHATDPNANILLMYSEAALNAWRHDAVHDTGEYSLNATQAFKKPCLPTY